MARRGTSVHVAALGMALWAVAVLAVVAVAAPAPASAGEHESKLDLVWVDPAGLAPGAYDVLKQESALVLEAVGPKVSWTEALDGVVLGPESMAVIAAPTHHAADDVTRHVMGATRADTSLPPAVWVYPDEVAWALGLDVRARSAWSPFEREMFGRALARVVSHEVVHALGVGSHAAHGLMSAKLDRRALIAPKIFVDPQTIATLKRAGGALVAHGPVPALSAARAVPGVEGVAAHRGPSS